jgi:hypothetical protein
MQIILPDMSNVLPRDYLNRGKSAPLIFTFRCPNNEKLTRYTKGIMCSSYNSLHIFQHFSKHSTSQLTVTQDMITEMQKYSQNY